MAKKFNFKSKSLWKKIGLGVLAGVVLIGAVFGVTALFRKAEEETQKEISPSWAIGGLTETGAYLETKESIYTKDAFECYGLKTSLEFDNNISYRLYFYNENNSFIESTSKLTDAFDSSKTNMPEETKYCRVVITPNDDSKISWYEKSGYANQLTIKVNKDQTKSDGVFVPVNLFEIDTTKIGQIVGANSGGDITYASNSKFGSSKGIDVSGISQLKFVYSEEHKSDSLTYFWFDSSMKNLSSCPFGTTTAGQLQLVIDVPSGASYLYVNYELGCEFSIYAI